MSRLLFEEKNGLIEVKEADENEERLDEGLIGTFSKGALLLGYMAVSALSALDPTGRGSSGLSLDKGLLGKAWEALSKMDSKGVSNELQALVKRSNQLKELSVGKITPQTILDVLGPVDELSEEEKKYLLASVAYRKLVERWKQELNQIDPDSKAYGKWKDKVFQMYNATRLGNEEGGQNQEETKTAGNGEAENARQA